MGHTLKNGSHLEESVTHRKKVTLGTIDHTLIELYIELLINLPFNSYIFIPKSPFGTNKVCMYVSTSINGPRLDKRVTLGKMGHIWKNGSFLEERSHLKQWVTLGKKSNTWRNGSHLEKWVILGRMGHVWKNGSHLEKQVTLGNMGHT